MDKQSSEFVNRGRRTGKTSLQVRNTLDGWVERGVMSQEEADSLWGFYLESISGCPICETKSE